MPANVHVVTQATLLRDGALCSADAHLQLAQLLHAQGLNLQEVNTLQTKGHDPDAAPTLLPARGQTALQRVAQANLAHKFQ